METSRLTDSGDIIIPKESWIGLMSVLSRISERFLGLVEPNIVIQDDGIDMPNDMREAMVNLALLGGLTADLACMPLMLKIESWQYDMFLAMMVKAFAAGLEQGGPTAASEAVVVARKRMAKLIMEKGLDQAHDIATSEAVLPNTSSPKLNKHLESMQDKLKRNMARQLGVAPTSEDPGVEIGVIALDPKNQEMADRIQAEFRKAFEANRPKNPDEMRKMMADIKAAVENPATSPLKNKVVHQESAEAGAAAVEGDRTADSVKDKLNSPEYLAMLADLENEE